MTNLIFGVLAATASPAFMTVGFVLWELHWKSTPYNLNCFKASLASFLFLVTSLSFSGRLFYASYTLLGWLVLSSFLGIVVGDNLWLLALKMIGSRRVIVIDAFKPFCGAILGNLFLDEKFSVLFTMGMFVTSIGVLLVALEKTNESGVQTNPIQQSPLESMGNNEHNVNCRQPIRTILSGSRLLQGYFFAAANVILDAFGNLLVKSFAAELTTFDINLVRFGSASTLLLTGYLALEIMKRKNFLGKTQNEFISIPSDDEPSIDLPNVESGPIGINPLETSKNSEVAPEKQIIRYADETSKAKWTSLGYVSLGVLLVTFITPSLSQYALFQLNLGLLMTLTSLGPIYAVPAVYFMKGETISWRACAGACIAVLGVCIMCSF